ncbi:protein TolR [Pelagibaculum spongiae]|uniref:Tol-Pal system protein TolR n=1 Tax=Pelagibaculum spongiae TaxID=2080658 RepID=A0A2V1GVT3_9GAMM|nr:protein TolR [Pelagibaculum spongiae]PVZ69444.1 protein TolR [Pelagibaculum spongiae]
MAQPNKSFRPVAEINVVPYIDVMLVLLIIFMVTAPLLTQGVMVELPSADAEALDSDSENPIIATVDADGTYYLNFWQDGKAPIKEIDIPTYVNAELSINPLRPVMVRGDESVGYGQVVRLMTLLQAGGAKSVGLMTESQEN